MNISKFFIERPVFAAVLSAFITIAGAISLFRLPISEYPEVVPPSIVVRASYPGANPQVISETVAAPLEQEIVGVEDMLYMSSQATLDGNLSLTITFRIGTDIDRAQVQVQNRVSSALPRLPDEVRALGVSTTKTSPDLMMAVNLVSADGRYDALYLRNYAVLNVKDELARLPGMGSVQVFGAGDYAMRIWLDPEKLAVRTTWRAPFASRTCRWPPDRSPHRPPPGRSSRSRSTPWDDCPASRSSVTSSSRQATWVKYCAWATLRAWRWAPIPMRCAVAWIATRP
jgi:multidrug efflux pump